MLPDDDRRYAIETCRSSESVLKSGLKINDIISAFVGCVIINELKEEFKTTTDYFCKNSKITLEYFNGKWGLHLMPCTTCTIKD